MRYYPGAAVTFKSPVTNAQATIISARATTYHFSNGQPQVLQVEYEVLKADGTIGWFNENCFY